MKWATRKNLGLNRPPCIWLIRRFLDPEAEILYLEPDALLAEAKRIGATSFHAPGADLVFDRAGQRTTFDAFLRRYGLEGKDAALDRVADILRDASFGVPAGAPRFPASAGLRALDRGFRLTTPDDGMRAERLALVYDALYEWCREEIAAATAPPA